MTDQAEIPTCICVDPENCTERVPGYRCKKDFMPRAAQTSNRKIPEFFGKLYPSDMPPEHSLLGTWIRRAEADALLTEIEVLRAALEEVRSCISHQDFMRVRRVVSAALDGDSRPVETSGDPAPSAMQALIKALKSDPDYAWALHCNLSMPIMDCLNCSQEAANRAGAALMQHLFQIDVTKHLHWMWGRSSEETSGSPTPHHVVYDKVGWICSICGLWNNAKDNDCAGIHLESDGSSEKANGNCPTGDWPCEAAKHTTTTGTPKGHCIYCGRPMNGSALPSNTTDR